MKVKGVIILEWFDDHLKIKGNLFDKLKNELSYWHRDMIYHAGEYDAETGKYVQAWTENKQKRVLLYSEEKEENIPYLLTYCGFKERVEQFCLKLGYKVFVKDFRLSFPKPNLVEGIKGLRSYQKKVFLDGISKDKGGCFALVTRYGKTYLMIALCKAYNVPIVIAAPGIDLLGQLVDDLQKALPNKVIKGVFTGSKTLKIKDVICE